MSTWSGRLLGVVTWVVVVTLGAVLVWVVISRAGAGLVSEADTVPTQPSAPTSTQPSTQPSAGPTPEPLRGTWQADAGVVTADCQGAAITLAGAQPAEDVVVKVLDPGPDQLVVTFRGEDAGTITLVARCRGGQPDFTVSDGAPSSPPPTSGDTGNDTGGDTGGNTGGDAGDDGGSN